VGVVARGILPRHWMQYRNVKKKTVLKTHILQDFNVQEHCCEKFLQVGSQGIGQSGPASRQLFQFWNKSV
jgi:DNA-directed RNA polymerase subunit N (RpoN/RPB10)